MQTDYCLILAAGFGTRMGKIGQILPKVLWPVFEKSLLELQVAFARSLGIKKIYVNLHFKGSEIESYCRNKSAFEGVDFLMESPDILDVGGAIHHLASRPDVNYLGRLLVINADQFFYFDRSILESCFKKFPDAPVVLFSYWVESDQGYNALNINPQRYLTGITKNALLPKGSRVETYTGISLIDLSQLRPVPGVSSFFDSVCNFNQHLVPVLLWENIDYWDFGTAKRYWDTTFRILKTYAENSNHPFLRFLVREKALKTWKINLRQNSYHADCAGVVNLTSAPINQELGPSIILSSGQIEKRSVPTIWWGELSDEIN